MSKTWSERLRMTVACLSLGIAVLVSASVAAAPRVPSLSGLRCADGEVARYDDATLGWVCSDALTELIDQPDPGQQQLKAFDDLGVEIGPVVGPSSALLEVTSGPLAGTFFTVTVARARLSGSQIFYSGPGCTGDAWVSAPQNTNVQGALQGAAVGPDPTNGGNISAFLLADPDSVSMPIAAASRYGLDTTTLTFSCTSPAGATEGRAAVPVLDLEQFVPPFVVHD